MCVLNIFLVKRLIDKPLQNIIWKKNQITTGMTITKCNINNKKSQEDCYNLTKPLLAIPPIQLF